jgi:hypothetical protein
MTMVQIVEGKPIRVEGRELIPIVRVETSMQRRVFVGSDGLAVHGLGSVTTQPIAILERSDGSERRIAIPDRTAQLLGGLLLAALVIPLLLSVAVRLTRGK